MFDIVTPYTSKQTCWLMTISDYHRFQGLWQLAWLEMFFSFRYETDRERERTLSACWRLLQTTVRREDLTFMKSSWWGITVHASDANFTVVIMMRQGKAFLSRFFKNNRIMRLGSSQIEKMRLANRESGFCLSNDDDDVLVLVNPVGHGVRRHNPIPNQMMFFSKPFDQSFSSQWWSSSEVEPKSVISRIRMTWGVVARDSGRKKRSKWVRSSASAIHPIKSKPYH